MYQKSQLTIVFLLGVIVGLLAWNILTLSSPNLAWADASGTTGGTSNGIIAVTGAVNQSTAGLWVIDARESDNSPTICLYVPKNEGRTIELSAARRIKYDIQLVEFNDKTTNSHRVNTLKRELSEINKKSEEKK